MIMTDSGNLFNLFYTKEEPRCLLAGTHFLKNQLCIYNNNPPSGYHPPKCSAIETHTVKADAQQFPQLQYVLFDSNGKIIRKGSVSNRLSEFRLSMVGLPAGNYELQMGSTSEKFSVVY